MDAIWGCLRTLLQRKMGVVKGIMVGGVEMMTATMEEEEPRI